MISATRAAGVGPRDHVVQFYRSDEELAGQVGGYLAEGSHDDGISIVIATAAHRRALEDRLAASGVDVAVARARGDYLAVDAEETLRLCMAGDGPDAAGFDRMACSLIEEPVRRGRSVRVYGELVDMLWDAGMVTSAVELEEMWVGLRRRLPFGLWCGYRATTTADDSVADVCRLHSAVLGHAPAGLRSGARAAELSRDFAGSLDSIGSARRFVVAALEAGGHGAVADDAALVVTELAANAVLHARSAFTVTVRAGADRIRIGVRDCAALLESALPAKPLHGLGAVAAMAVRWGVVPAAPGKDVWAELGRLGPWHGHGRPPPPVDRAEAGLVDPSFVDRLDGYAAPDASGGEREHLRRIAADARQVPHDDRVVTPAGQVASEPAQRGTGLVRAGQPDVDVDRRRGPAQQARGILHGPHLVADVRVAWAPRAQHPDIRCGTKQGTHCRRATLRQRAKPFGCYVL